jgi:hypothetical protein
MKRSVFVLALGALFLIARPSFALIDGEIFGGYTYGGKLDAGSENVNLSGWNYGIRGHLNRDFAVFKIGLGGYLQKSPLTFDLLSQNYKYERTNIGSDLYIRLTPFPLVKPYARLGISFVEYGTTKGGGSSSSQWKYFNTYYVGGGIGLMPPIPMIDIMVYAEYLYNSRFSGGTKMICHTIDVGFLFGF